MGTVSVEEKYKVLSRDMTERQRREWAGLEAMSLGWGGVTAVAKATGLSRATIQVGVKEVQQMLQSRGAPKSTDRVRRPGAGRKPLEENDATLIRDLDAMVDPVTVGDPMSPLRWTCKSVRQLTEALAEKGHRINRTKVGEILTNAGYSLQGNRKTLEGNDHPDRDAQFQYIARSTRSFLRRGQPVISVDTKKKELIGQFKNGGQEWRPKKTPVHVKSHDFPDKELGKVIPYGIYDLQGNQGYVNVGVDRDTPEFAVESIRRWWRDMGKRVYPNATELLITADAGGSNSTRARLWKFCLQRLADRTGLRITVCHFPPGTSKWNKIEHRMFCHITQNWRGQPLVTREVVVNLIANTTTSKGLRITAKLDQHAYEKGVSVSDEQMASLQITRAKFHGDWNYAIAPAPAARN